MFRINDIISPFLLKEEYRLHRHLLVQLVVFLITMNIFWDEPDTFLPERWTVWIAYFLLIDAVIYVNLFFLVPRLLLKGKTLYFLLSLLILMLFAAFVIGLLQEMAPAADSGPEPSLVEGIIGGFSTIAGFSFLVAGLTAFHLFKNRLANSNRITELETVTMKIELANLQEQINPHFLFNIINNANILAVHDVNRSAHILSRLNDLLRYQVEGSYKTSVTLKDEIVFLNNYLELEKTRRDRFGYFIDVQGNDEIIIPPHLFIPFVENAVKHNPGNDSYVNVNFRVDGDKVFFRCENPKIKLQTKNIEGGIGLVNVKKRLELLFGNYYSLQIKDGDEYIVTLEFEL